VGGVRGKKTPGRRGPALINFDLTAADGTIIASNKGSTNMKKRLVVKVAGWCWLLPLLGALLLSLSGCEKTITEPGEPEHGGLFLHHQGPSATTNP